MLIRNLVLLLALVSGLNTPAEMREFIREYKHQAGDADSKISSRKVAVSSVRQLLLGEIGTYIHSEINTGVDETGKQFNNQKVTALTAGLVKIEILDETWNGYEYYIKARLHVDVDDLLQKIKEFAKNNQQTQADQYALLQSQQENENLLKKIEQLNQQLATTDGRSIDEIEKILSFYQSAQEKLSVQQMVDNGNNSFYAAEPDYEKALYWYQQAAELGHPDAQNKLGVFHFMAYGLPKNAEKAFEWQLKAAQQGHMKAQYNIGNSYYLGRGIEKDDKQAFQWIQRAAKQNDAQSKAVLGQFYYAGTGVRKSMADAHQWFYQAAQDGDAYSQGRLAYMLMVGQGVTQNTEAGLQWYKRGASGGDAYSQFSLGNFYYEGKVLTKDQSLALDWMKKAAAQGYPSAVKFLEERAK